MTYCSRHRCAIVENPGQGVGCFSKNLGRGSMILYKSFTEYTRFMFYCIFIWKFLKISWGVLFYTPLLPPPTVYICDSRCCTSSIVHPTTKPKTVLLMTIIRHTKTLKLFTNWLKICYFICNDFVKTYQWIIW